MAERQEITPDLYAQLVYEEGDGIVVDLQSVEEMKFELIPKGIYNAEIDEVQFGNSKSSGAPMFTINYRITDGAYENRKLFQHVSFSPKALPGTKGTLLRIDPTIFSGPFRPEKVAQSGQLLNKKVRLKITHEDYDGEARAKVRDVLPPEVAANAEGGGSFFNAGAAA